MKKISENIFEEEEEVVQTGKLVRINCEHLIALREKLAQEISKIDEKLAKIEKIEADELKTKKAAESQ